MPNRLITCFLATVLLSGPASATSLEQVQSAVLKKDWLVARSAAFAVIKENPQSQIIFDRAFDFYQKIPSKHLVERRLEGSTELKKLYTRVTAGDARKNFYISVNFEPVEIKQIRLQGARIGQVNLNRVDKIHGQSAYVSDGIRMQDRGDLFLIDVEFTSGDKASYRWVMEPPKIDGFTKNPMMAEVSGDGITVTWHPFVTNSFRAGDRVVLYHTLFSGDDETSIVWSDRSPVTYDLQLRGAQRRVLSLTELGLVNGQGTYSLRTSFEERKATPHMVIGHITRFRQPILFKK